MGAVLLLGASSCLNPALGPEADAEGQASDGLGAPAVSTDQVLAQRKPGALGDPSEVGKLGPLIPFHKDAIHAALVWTGPERDTPKVCFWMRPSHFVGTHLVDPDGLSPDGGETGGFIAAFEQIVRGGSEFSNRLDRSVQTRIKADIPMDNGLCLDLTHPDAFKNDGKYQIADYDPVSERWVPVLTEEDFDLNRDAFTNAGHSVGLNYNVFCAGNVQLADGRLLFVGGHDKDGDKGIRKINIFDPATESWVHRDPPAVKTAYLEHFAGTGSPPYPDANDEANTDPPLPSDMKYQRWYPSAVTLPSGKVLILAGTDEDSSVEDPVTMTVATPEIYDPITDTTKALESARKAHPTYPLAYVVQTGPGKDDWKVAVTGEVAEPPASFPSGQVPEQRRAAGRTYYLDVQAALATCDEPGASHWELIDTALTAHHRAGAAALWELDHRGMAKSQRVAAFGGSDGVTVTSIVEMIDYSDEKPRWKRQDDLVQPVDDNYAVVLPSGQVLVVGGESPRDHVPRYSLFYQLFDPKTGKVEPLVETSVVRKDHTSALLLPDATVLVMGSDRTELVPDDLIPGIPGDRDIGVPVGQIYEPAYLFRGPRPVIEHAPEEIDYGSTFEVEVSCGDEQQIGSVVLIRPSPETHKWDWGNRYLELSFERGKDGNLEVVAPAVPGLAVPGYYMLFVLDKKGVPSIAKLVHFSVPD